MRYRAETGSVLLLMPAAIVVVLLLGAIAVDSAIVYLGQRRAYDVALDAANDAAGAGLDRDTARTTGALVHDPVRVREIAAATIGAAQMDGITLVAARTHDGLVEVTVDVRVQRLFGRAFGGRAAETVRISARAVGEARGP